MTTKIKSVDIGKRTKEGYRTKIRNDHTGVRIDKVMRSESEAKRLADRVVYDG